MNVELSANARKLVAQSPAGKELAEFADWMAAEKYTPFVTELHLRRLAYIIPQLPNAAPGASYSLEQLEAVFGRERSSGVTRKHYMSMSPMPPIPPIPPPCLWPSSLGNSATIASVVRMRVATEAAFSSAQRVTLVGSSTPISTRSP